MSLLNSANAAVRLLLLVLGARNGSGSKFAIGSWAGASLSAIILIPSAMNWRIWFTFTC